MIIRCHIDDGATRAKAASLLPPSSYQTHFLCIMNNEHHWNPMNISNSSGHSQNIFRLVWHLSGGEYCYNNEKEMTLWHIDVHIHIIIIDDVFFTIIIIIISSNINSKNIIGSRTFILDIKSIYSLSGTEWRVRVGRWKIYALMLVSSAYYRHSKSKYSSLSS